MGSLPHGTGSVDRTGEHLFGYFRCHILPVGNRGRFVEKGEASFYNKYVLQENKRGIMPETLGRGDAERQSVLVETVEEHGDKERE